MNMPPPMEGNVAGHPHPAQPNAYAYAGVAGCWICNDETIQYQHIFYGVPMVTVKLEPKHNGFVLTLLDGVNVVAQHIHVCTKVSTMQMTPVTENTEDFNEWKKELGWDE